MTKFMGVSFICFGRAMPPETKRTPRILVVNPFGIGDVIFSMTVAEEIRRAFPEALIGFVCNERTQGLVRLNTSIDQTYVFNRGRFRRLWARHPFFFYQKLKALLASLREARFETAVDFSLGREYPFFAWWIGIRRRIGFDFKGRGFFLTHKDKLEGYDDRPVADTQLALLGYLGIRPGQVPSRLPLHVSAAVRNEAAAFLKKNGFYENDKILGLAPGGGRSWGSNAYFKQWDPEKFAAAANAWNAARGHKILLLGDRGESDLLSRTAGLIRAAKAVAAGEALEKVCGLLLRCQALLCNDGGLLHLANALGVRTVSLFGPVDEKVYGPYGEGTPHEVLTEPVPCRPCYRRFHFPPCPYERRCLSLLPQEKVLKALEKIACLSPS